VVIPEDLLPSIAVYPNPLTSNSKLKIPVSDSGKVVIKLYNITGQLIREKLATLNEGMNELTLREYQMIPAGEYLLVVRGDNYQHAIRVIR
jgi:hypothetical protein